MDLAEIINRFGVKIVSDLLAQKRDDLDSFPNTILSPQGLYLVLAMAQQGARGSTADEFASLLGMAGGDGGQHLDGIRALLAAPAQKPAGMETLIANSLWVKQGVSLRPDYEKMCTDAFMAQVENLDFASAEATNAINAWVKEKTNARIDRILEKIPGNALLYLINALYFKGIWKKPFEAGETRPDEFTLLGGATKQVAMMNQSGTYPYAQTEDFQALALPYTADAASLVLFLPALADGDIAKAVTAFQEKIQHMDWGNILNGFHRREGNIAVPRFTTNTSINMKATLQHLGLNSAFSDQTADFGAMLQDPSGIYISDVIHKTCFEVNEEGTEAAAVSKVEMVTKSVMLRFSFNLNRPFFFVLLDHGTKAAQFMGWVVDPD